jgi:Tfp pilus assembly protein PilF
VISPQRGSWSTKLTRGPEQSASLNLRGEVLPRAEGFDGAEREFQKALKADPKLRDAQYNLAQVPFKKKEYTKARDRFEALFSTTSGAIRIARRSS